MKYGSYLVEGKSVRGILCCVCVMHVTAEWVRDRNDCLWDGAGMRNHHRSNMCLICTLSCLSMDSGHMCSCWGTREHISNVCMFFWSASFVFRVWPNVGTRQHEVAQDGLMTVCIKWLNKPSMLFSFFFRGEFPKHSRGLRWFGCVATGASHRMKHEP